MIIDPDLNEISYGEWDGLAWSDIEEKYPSEATAKLACWTAVTPPGSEDWSELERRVSRALTRIVMDPSPAIVVKHVTINAQITYQLIGGDPSLFTQKYAEVLVYDF